MNKIIINVNGILVRTVLKMRAYCSMSQNFSTFSTPHDALFLVFSVSNAKYLAFDTSDENALTTKICLGSTMTAKNQHYPFGFKDIN